MPYINIKYDNQVETIDEFDTMKETRKMLTEYIIADPSGGYYISTRCTKEWKER